jgi:adenylate kinase
MNLVILGPQGSGKGTQADLLTDRYGFKHIETGKKLRKVAASDHPLAEQIRKMINSGVLVSDEILMLVIQDEISEANGKNLIFDGTPRNTEQYQMLDKILEKFGGKLDKVILIDIPEAETVKRLSSRKTCQSCGKVFNLLTKLLPESKNCECGGILIKREDDTPEAIKQRLSIYKTQTQQVINEARKRGILLEIDGNKPIEDIHREIVRRLGI